ncbi:hypothetical protein DTJ15_09020 [Parasaccharibacter sp. TMW 2.1891]|nr:hypothetical protein [Parasaccharibacter sp. TMW 2.1891]
MNLGNLYISLILIKKIGEYTQGEGKFYDTTIGSIHVSKKGAHIVPAAPKGWENK